MTAPRPAHPRAAPATGPAAPATGPAARGEAAALPTTPSAPVLEPR